MRHALALSLLALAPASLAQTGPLYPGALYPAGGSPEAVGVADVNVDGTLDLVLGRSDGIAVLLGLGGGRFGAPTAWDFGGPAASLVVGDFSADGFPDAAVVHSG